MSAQANYVKLGLFVLISLVLIIGALIVLGGGRLWTEHIGVETYLDESAQGLETGSVVKMRGVQVGNIQNISFVYIKYPDAFEAGHRYVLVEIGLQPDKFGDISRDEFTVLLAEEIRNGLRVRITPQGLTGSAFLELDYTSPFRAPPLPINWQPARPYIPSAPGTIARFEETFESVSRTLKNIEVINLEEFVERLEDLVTVVLDKVENIQTDLISSEAVGLLGELRQTNEKFSRLLGDLAPGQQVEADVHGILADISRTVQELRAMAEGMNHWIQSEEGGVEDLRMSVADLRRSMAQTPEMVDEFSAAADIAQQGFVQLQQLLRQVQLRLNSQLEQIDALLHNLERSSENVREITEDARDYPSRLFFGEPPRGSRN
ncbi:paraquat-inducible protein B [Desulfonatronum thiosulfatophilum]|uniref:Paraquat-inducible protein B n=1 Tax=Desulfonatronum thiosulfatophilum TaxID=617002 RepID=A0A1G6A0P8_9BACT|nr:MlaD family protein [Desulfonatronum thiosulfatophilum]SDB01796.1 paraquat-inducible protein B [Desulfonatronum thiosulfatophilum]